MNTEPGFELADLGGMVRRRAPLALAIAGVLFLLTFWVAMALPNQYRAYSTLLVEPQAISDRLVEAGVADSDLNNRLHLMASEILSRSKLSRTIDDLDLYEDESARMTREEVIDLMRSNIRVQPVLPELDAAAAAGARRSSDIVINTFQIQFDHRSPQIASQVVQRLANDFIEKHIDARVATTQKSLRFIQGERERLAAQIRDVEEEIAAIKSENPGRLPEDLTANQRLLESTISDLRSAQRQLDLARSDAAFWANQVLASSTVGGANEETPARRLQALELALAELKARGFTDAHPDVVKTRIELEEIEAQMEAMEDEDAEGPKSFAQQNAEAERRRAELRERSVAEEVGRLQEQVSEIQGRIAATPRVAEQLDSLSRRYEALGLAEADFSQRAQEASVQADLERRQLGEQFRVLEAAFPPPNPFSPNRPLILVLGLILGLIAGFGIALLIEASDSSVHGVRELQDALGVPVLASIPSIVLESDRVLRTRRLVRNAVAAGVLAVFCLAGGALTYMLVNGAPGWLGGGEAPAAQGGGQGASLGGEGARG